MSGPLTQLSAIGAQDSYLQIDSEVTFFKQLYKRHTNFAIDAQYQPFNQTPKLNGTTICQINRTADLINKVWLHITLPALNNDTVGVAEGARYCDEVGFAAIRDITFSIGNVDVDVHPGHYLQVWNQLTCPEEKRFIDHLVGRTGGDIEALRNNARKTQDLWIPLQFFWNRWIGYSLPLIALQYHETRITVRFNSMADIVAELGNGRTSVNSIPTDTFNAELLCNYIYLDDPERHWFAGNAHEYLIEQLQYQGDVPTTESMTVYNATFNHPCIELIWVLISKAALDAHEPFCYGALNLSWNAAGDPLTSAKLSLNGHDRFSNQPPEYFREIVPSQCHTAIPRKNIYVYCFALEPEDWRPSGTLNMSRIDSVRLYVSHVDFQNVHHPNLGYDTDGQLQTVKGGFLRVYCRSRNVLRISNGLGGVLFAN